MDREKFVEKKQLEIQEEVDFLRKEKNNTYKESSILYEDIKDKVAELRQCVIKEDSVNKRLKLIDESGAQTYGVYTGSPLNTSYSINRSLTELENLAKSTFDVEEFNKQQEDKENSIDTKTVIDLQKENNELLLLVVETLKQIKDDSEDITVDSIRLASTMQAQYNTGGH